MTEGEPVLCYVEGDVMTFTTQPLAEQWGDDWDDAPYDCNAGPPYCFTEHEANRGKTPYELIDVRFSGDFETPSTHAFNTPYSVELINQRAVPWLQSDRNSATPFQVKVWAGWTIRECVGQILRAGGMVYAPIDGSLDRWLKEG